MTKLKHLHILKLQEVLLTENKTKELLEITKDLIREAETKKNE